MPLPASGPARRDLASYDDKLRRGTPLHGRPPGPACRGRATRSAFSPSPWRYFVASQPHRLEVWGRVLRGRIFDSCSIQSYRNGVSSNPPYFLIFIIFLHARTIKVRQLIWRLSLRTGETSRRQTFSQPTKTL